MIIDAEVLSEMTNYRTTFESLIILDDLSVKHSFTPFKFVFKCAKRISPRQYINESAVARVLHAQTKDEYAFSRRGQTF